MLTQSDATPILYVTDAQEYSMTTDDLDQLPDNTIRLQNTGDMLPDADLDEPFGTADSYTAYLKVMISRGWVPYRLKLTAIDTKMREQGKPPQIVAQLAALNRNAVTKILNGQTRFPTMRAIEGIAYALDCNVADITEGGYFRRNT